MLASLAFAAIAAGAVGVSTYAVVQLTRAENQHRAEELEQYKADAASDIADANERAAEANRIAEGERLARVKLEAKIAPRSLPQAQQNELAEKLRAFEKQTGTITAAPSMPENEWFAMALAASLRKAGWDMNLDHGSPTATILFPTGVVIQYAITSDDANESTPARVAAEALAAELNALEIDVTAVPMVIEPPSTMLITVTPR